MAGKKTSIADLVAAAHDANRIGFQLADQRAREEAAKAEAAVKRFKRARNVEYQRKCRAKRKQEKASGASSDVPWMDVGTTCNDLEEVDNEEPPEAVEVIQEP